MIIELVAKDDPSLGEAISLGEGIEHLGLGCIGGTGTDLVAVGDCDGHEISSIVF